MIIKSFTNSREGNDCLIKDTIIILEIEEDYVILHQTNYIGSWCDDEPRRTYYNAKTEQEALKIFNKVVREVI